MAAPKPRTPASEWERIAITALKRCTFPVGSWDKRFVRSLNIEAGLTDNERPQLWRLFLRYRRQLRDGYSHSLEMWRWAEEHAAPDLRKQRKEQAEKAKYMEAMKQKLERNEVAAPKTPWEPQLQPFQSVLVDEMNTAIQQLQALSQIEGVSKNELLNAFAKRVEDDPNSGITESLRIKNALEAAGIDLTPDTVFVMREYIRAGIKNDVFMRRFWEVRLNSIKIEQEKRKFLTFLQAQRPINEPQIFVDESVSVQDALWDESFLWDRPASAPRVSRPAPKPAPKPEPKAPSEPLPERPFDFTQD